MSSQAELYLARAENELIAAQILFKISSEEMLQKKEFQLKKMLTFYSSVISHAYYCIFFSAKARLIAEGIKTDSPNVHKKTIDAFELHLVNTGKLDFELLKIYKTMILRADELLQIFSREKRKRGEFTYQTLPQANKAPADDSLKNAELFFKTMNKVIG